MVWDMRLTIRGGLFLDEVLEHFDGFLLCKVALLPL